MLKCVIRYQCFRQVIIHSESLLCFIVTTWQIIYIILDGLYSGVRQIHSPNSPFLLNVSHF